jgi:hypothetical protein
MFPRTLVNAMNLMIQLSGVAGYNALEASPVPSSLPPLYSPFTNVPISRIFYLVFILCQAPVLFLCQAISFMLGYVITWQFPFGLVT